MTGNNRFKKLEGFIWALEFARVTESTASAVACWVGKGDKEANEAAVTSMRLMFDTVSVDDIVVIGDEVPMLYMDNKIPFY